MLTRSTIITMLRIPYPELLEAFNRASKTNRTKA